MALFDFLGQPVGGYQSSYSRGEKYLQPRNNISWGQLLGMLGTTSGSQSDRVLGGYLNQGFQLPQQRQPEPLQLGRQNQSDDSSDLDDIMSLVGAIYGAPI